MILLVLSMTFQELHNSFKDFYGSFDKDSDLYVSKEEFLAIIKSFYFGFLEKFNFF